MNKKLAVCAIATMLATMSIFSSAFAETKSKDSHQQSQKGVGVTIETNTSPSSIAALAASGVTAGPFILRQGGGWPGYNNHSVQMVEKGKIAINIVQQGIHKDQKAATRWTLEDYNGNVVATYDVNGDYNPFTLTFNNVQQGTYNLAWETLNSYDTQGNYIIYAPAGTVIN